MNVMLTSCGLETKALEAQFKKMLKKTPEEAKAIFIPTAATSAGAIEVLPKCMNDLLKCGIKGENIFVYDLYDNLTAEFLEQYDIIYLCGGSPEYLLRRINQSCFGKHIHAFIERNGLVLGVKRGEYYLCRKPYGSSGSASLCSGCTLRQKQLRKARKIRHERKKANPIGK